MRAIYVHLCQRTDHFVFSQDKNKSARTLNRQRLTTDIRHRQANIRWSPATISTCWVLGIATNIRQTFLRQCLQYQSRNLLVCQEGCGVWATLRYPGGFPADMQACMCRYPIICVPPYRLDMNIVLGRLFVVCGSISN